MGDTMYVRYLCPCWMVYQAKRAIEIRGRPTINGGTYFRAEYQNTKTEDLYLVNKKVLIDEDFAIPLRNERMLPESAILQFRGAKSGRQWPLLHPEDVDAFVLAGYDMSNPSWRLQYIGPDKANSNVLRFSVEDDFRGVTSEKLGQVEYVHDLSAGKEFVIRGVRFRVNEISSDGLIHYTVLSEGP